MIEKITKQEVKELIEDLEVSDIHRIGAFIYENKCELFLSYNGQGLVEPVYNNKYDEIIEFKDTVQDREYTLNEKVDIIEENINEMISDFNSEN